MANVIGGKLSAVGNIQISDAAPLSSTNRSARNKALVQRALQFVNKVDRSMAGYMGSLAEARTREPLATRLR